MSKNIVTLLSSSPKIIDYIIKNNNLDQETYRIILSRKVNNAISKIILHLIKHKFQIEPTIENLFNCNESWRYNILEMLDLICVENLFKYFIESNSMYNLENIYEYVLEYENAYSLLDVDLNDNKYIKYFEIFSHDVNKYRKLLEKIIEYNTLQVNNDIYERLYEKGIKNIKCV